MKKKVKLKTYFLLGRNRVTFLIFSRTLFLLFTLKSFFLHIYHLYQLSRRAGPEKPANPQGLYKIPRKMSHVTYSHIKIYIYLHVCNLSKYYWEYHILFKHFCVYYQRLSLVAKSGRVNKADGPGHSLLGHPSQQGRSASS